jgi:hypothetical protein
VNHYASLPESDWPLGQAVDEVRRKRLVQPQEFKSIVRTMLSQIEVLKAYGQPAPKNQAGRRSVAMLRTDPNALDIFFNSASGYRAQYLHDPALGEDANRYVIQTIFGEIGRALSDQAADEELRTLFELSLAHPWAKVWIHQGTWLLWSKRDQRILLVPSWQAELKSGDKHRRKLARWGSLAPEFETRFIIKGGYVDSGIHLKTGKSALDRRQEIHTLGFT